VAGLVLVAADVILGRIGGLGFTLVQAVLILAGVLGLLGVGMALLGRTAARMFRDLHLTRWLAALMIHWRIAAGLLGAILLWASVNLGYFVLASSIAPCASWVVATSITPDQMRSAEDYVPLGDDAYAHGTCSQAIAAYTQVIARNPQDARAYNNRAYTYMVLHQFDRALPDLDKAIAIRPDYRNALMNRGDIYNYHYAINYDRAIADYDRVMALGPHYASVDGHMLYACTLRGDVGLSWIWTIIISHNTPLPKIGPDCHSLTSIRS
jgi:tetratricopeptide (TPR) repeat protein